MHDYSIDRHPKEKILFGLAYVAILLAGYVNAQLPGIERHFGWTFAISLPVLTLYLGMYWLFNNVLWKYRVARKFLLIPDLNGQWRCAGVTTRKDGNVVDVPWVGEMTIVQSWSRISVVLKTKSSSSQSVAASLKHEAGSGYRLLYQYANDPEADQPDLHRHGGSANLLFEEECGEAKGHYFTDHDRQTVGVMKLTRTRDVNTTR